MLNVFSRESRPGEAAQLISDRATKAFQRYIENLRRVRETEQKQSGTVNKTKEAISEKNVNVDVEKQYQYGMKDVEYS